MSRHLQGWLKPAEQVQASEQVVGPSHLPGQCRRRHASRGLFAAIGASGKASRQPVYDDEEPKDGDRQEEEKENKPAKKKKRVQRLPKARPATKPKKRPREGQQLEGATDGKKQQPAKHQQQQPSKPRKTPKKPPSKAPKRAKAKDPQPSKARYEVIVPKRARGAPSVLPKAQLKAIERLAGDAADEAEEDRIAELAHRPFYTHEGEKTTLHEVAAQLKHDKLLRNKGGDTHTIRSLPRWLQNEEIPGVELRPHAFKQQLRPEEEAWLGLAKMGLGSLWQASRIPLIGRFLLGQKQMALGVYSQPEYTEQALSNWQGLDPAKVLLDRRFYRDVINKGNKIELTLMAMPTSPVPLKSVRDQLGARLQASLREQWKSKRRIPDSDKKAMRALVNRFTGAHLKNTGLISQGSLMPGSHFIFSCGPKMQLNVEAITPEPHIKDRKTVWLGHYKSPSLTRALFDAAIGDFPVDLDLKSTSGQNLLYTVNGRRWPVLGPANPTFHRVAALFQHPLDAFEIDGPFGHRPMSEIRALQ